LGVTSRPKNFTADNKRVQNKMFVWCKLIDFLDQLPIVRYDTSLGSRTAKSIRFHNIDQLSGSFISIITLSSVVDPVRSFLSDTSSRIRIWTNHSGSG
jgi:hypothetical protein